MSDGDHFGAAGDPVSPSMMRLLCVKSRAEKAEADIRPRCGAGRGGVMIEYENTMTLEEAIAHAREHAGKTPTSSCGMEHAQLADWLEELRRRRAAAGEADLARIRPVYAAAEALADSTFIDCDEKYDALVAAVEKAKAEEGKR